MFSQRVQLQQQPEQEVISQPISVTNHSTFDFITLLSQLWPITLKDSGEDKRGSIITV